jgi:hypothetical protein
MSMNGFPKFILQQNVELMITKCNFGLQAESGVDGENSLLNNKIFVGDIPLNSPDKVKFACFICITVYLFSYQDCEPDTAAIENVKELSLPLEHPGHGQVLLNQI